MHTTKYRQNCDKMKINHFMTQILPLTYFCKTSFRFITEIKYATFLR